MSFIVSKSDIISDFISDVISDVIFDIRFSNRVTKTFTIRGWFFDFKGGFQGDHFFRFVNNQGFSNNITLFINNYDMKQIGTEKY